MARPTIYSEELAEKICLQIEEGKSLVTICDDEDMPSRSSVNLWLKDNRNGFSDRYARAKEIQADYLVEQMLKLCDDVKDDNPTAVAKAKLQIDTRKWTASKLKPKSYGEKVTQEITGKDGGAIKVDTKQDLSSLSDEELELYERLATLRSERDKAREV